LVLVRETRISRCGFELLSARSDDGGAIFFDQSGTNLIEIEACNFVSCSAYLGGAICVVYAGFKAVNCCGFWNSATYGGGFAYCHDNPSWELSGSIAVGNHASDYGGTFYCSTGTLAVFTLSNFSANDVVDSYGTSICLWYAGSRSISSCRFTEGFAGRAIVTTHYAANATIRQSFFLRNAGPAAGAIDSTSSVTLRSCWFSNTSIALGGSGTVRVSDSFFDVAVFQQTQGLTDGGGNSFNETIAADVGTICPNPKATNPTITRSGTGGETSSGTGRETSEEAVRGTRSAVPKTAGHDP
jgi:hypothetical protein